MPDAMMQPHSKGKFVKLLLIANLCLWVYFWLAFAQASYRYRPDPLGHPAGTGYTYWGHSIAVTESGLKYPFFKTVFYVQLPSFMIAVLVERVFDPPLISHRFFVGVSMAGWSLLATMLLSFLQWYLVALVVQKLWRRRSRHPLAAPSHAPSTQASG
jgi:hypothetical protein